MDCRLVLESAKTLPLSQQAWIIQGLIANIACVSNKGLTHEFMKQLKVKCTRQELMTMGEHADIAVILDKLSYDIACLIESSQQDINQIYRKHIEEN